MRWNGRSCDLSVHVHITGADATAIETEPDIGMQAQQRHGHGAVDDFLAEELARKLLSWKHSGFSVHNGKPIKRDDADGLQRVAQYIIRNPFYFVAAPSSLSSEVK